MLVSVVAQVLAPLVLKRLIDVEIADESRDGVVRMGLAYALLFIVGAAATFAQVVILARMGLGVVKTLKERLFGHVLHLSLAYFDRNPPGRLLARIESDSERLQMLFAEVSIAMVRTALLVVGMFCVMFATDWRATLAILALVVPLVTVTIIFFHRMRRLHRRVRALYARISEFVTEYVQGVSVVRLFGYETRARKRLRALNQDKLIAERDASMWGYSFWGGLTAVEVAAVMGIVYVGAGHRFGAEMTPGVLVLFLVYLRQAFGPLAMFSEQLSFVQRAFASADRVFGVLDTPSRTPDADDALDAVPDDWRELAFENVVFEYDGGTRAIDGVSFSVRRGERVAMVGASGGGKTTLTSLLLRYYEPTEGRVALDGVDIRRYRQRAWRARVGLVLQDIHLFPGTVGENLRALAEDIPPEAIERAVGVVGAADLVARLASGYDEPLTEGGANLSMGERQLLCFARAIVRDPDFLVLDEATSSVDPGTERRLQQSMDRLLAGRTSLIIAHRLATVVGADRILVVSHGRIVEEGTHAELYERDGIYRDLFDLQFRKAGAA